MTPREICASCGRRDAGLHPCGSARAGIGPQLAALRAEVERLRDELADAKALIATMEPAAGARP